MFTIILNSGTRIPNIKTIDSTKSPIGLWIWSTKQVGDQLISFDKITIRSSQIAAIIEEEPKTGNYTDNNMQSLMNQENIIITDNDLPYNMRGGK